jgi:hypothetical protein
MTAVVSAGALATTSDGQRTAVLEHTGTSVVLFSGQHWQRPVAALAISQFATGPISERFNPNLSWDSSGNILAMLTCEGQLCVVDGMPVQPSSASLNSLQLVAFR